MIGIPERTEASEYYFTYIDQVGEGDICEVLDAQAGATLALLHTISDEQSLHRYAPGKWSIRQVVGHMNDAERLFVFRAFWFARGFETELPSFDEKVAVSAAGAEERSWDSHVEEFRAVRGATTSFFRSLPAHAWGRHGIASGNRFTVRALAYIAAGHIAHHNMILRNRYLKR